MAVSLCDMTTLDLFTRGDEVRNDMNKQMFVLACKLQALEPKMDAYVSFY